MGNETYIRFTTDISVDSAERLFRILNKLPSENCNKIHLMIHSTGGSFDTAILLYNQLRGFPSEIYTYNIGAVQSGAILLYCAGKKRFCFANSSFMIHDAFIEINPGKFEQKQLQEGANNLKRINETMAEIISSTTGTSIEKVNHDMTDTTYFNPETAQKYGLVHEIKEPFIPNGVEILSVGEILPGESEQSGCGKKGLEWY